MQITQSEYFEQVKLIASSVIEALIDKGGGNIRDRVYQSVDWHEYIIYTYKAQLVLIYSPNSDRHFQDFGHIESKSEGDLYPKLAHSAMCADINKKIDSLLDDNGFDRWDLETGGIEKLTS